MFKGKVKSTAFKVLFVVVALMLVIPSMSFANDPHQSSKKASLSMEEITSILEKDSVLPAGDQEVVTPEEFSKISEKVKYYHDLDPSREVDVEKVIQDLKLPHEVHAVTEDKFSQFSKQIKPTNKGLVSAGSVGFDSYNRTSTNFNANAHVANLVPFTTIAQIGGYVQGYAIVPLSSSYLIVLNRAFDERNVTFGQTKIDAYSVAHYGNIAKMTISAVVYDSGDTATVYNQIISNTNGTFSN